MCAWSGIWVYKFMLRSSSFRFVSTDRSHGKFVSLFMVPGLGFRILGSSFARFAIASPDLHQGERARGTRTFQHTARRRDACTPAPCTTRTRAIAGGGAARKAQHLRVPGRRRWRRRWRRGRRPLHAAPRAARFGPPPPPALTAGGGGRFTVLPSGTMLVRHAPRKTRVPLCARARTCAHARTGHMQGGQ